MTDRIDIIYQIVYGLSEPLIEFYFFARLTEKKCKFIQYIPFTVLSYIVTAIPYLNVLFKLAFLISILSLSGIYVLKTDFRTSVLYAVSVLEMMQLCWGISDSALGIISPFLFPANPLIFGYVFMAGGSLFALCLASLCYFIILRFLQPGNPVRNQYVLMILIPFSMILMVSGYINFTFYTNNYCFSPWLEMKHVQMLVIQILAVSSVFSVLFAYQKLMDSFSLHTKLSMLEQESHFQKQYVEEARVHYNETKSLQHDMKNHLTVIKGLLDRGSVEKAGAYIAELDIAADHIAFSFQTNNPVLDILLENKMTLANSRGISVSGSLKVPYPCSVNDLDFCIILSNALDNAIHACEEWNTDTKKYIRISSRRQGDFLMIEVLNSFNGSRNYKRGTGLSNIKWVTEKYNGAMGISMQDHVFCLNILLIISQHPQSISQQSC